MSAPSGKPGRLVTPIYLALLSAILTVLLSTLFLQTGIALSPDGWAYWEGAVSLLKGNGYTYFGGEPLTDWGVLFPLYLAGVQKLIGIHGQALRVSILLLAGLTSGAWVYLFTKLTNPTAGRWTPVLYALYVATFISLYYRILLSETLFLLLLAGLFSNVQSFYQHEQSGQTRLLPIFGITLLTTLLLICRNMALTFLPGLTIVLVLSLQNRNWHQRIVLPLVVNFLALGGWLGFRALFGQVGSHPVTIGGRYTPLHYAQQLLAGMADLVGPHQLGLGWVGLAMLGATLVYLTYSLLPQKNRPQTAEQRVLCYLLILLVSGTGGIYLLFNFTDISDPLNDRFLWQLPLGMMGFLAATLTWQPPIDQRRLRLVLALIATVQVLRTGKMLLHQVQETEIPAYIVTATMTIAPEYIAGPPLAVGPYTLVAPPSYDWVDRNYQSHSGRQSQ